MGKNANAGRFLKERGFQFEGHEQALGSYSLSVLSVSLNGRGVLAGWEVRRGRRWWILVESYLPILNILLYE